MIFILLFCFLIEIYQTEIWMSWINFLERYTYYVELCAHKIKYTSSYWNYTSFDSRNIKFIYHLIFRCLKQNLCNSMYFFTNWNCPFCKGCVWRKFNKTIMSCWWYRCSRSRRYNFDLEHKCINDLLLMEVFKTLIWIKI